MSKPCPLTVIFVHPLTAFRKLIQLSRSVIIFTITFISEKTQLFHETGHI